MKKKCLHCKKNFLAKRRPSRPTGYQQFCCVVCARSFRKGKKNPRHSEWMKNAFATGKLKSWCEGKKLSAEHREKLRIARTGKEPWNKGIEFEQMKGNKHAFLGDNATKNAGHWRARQILNKITPCEQCGKKKERRQMVVHHIDENPLNNDLKNLQRLCRSCHINHHREALLAGKK